MNEEILSLQPQQRTAPTGPTWRGCSTAPTAGSSCSCTAPSGTYTRRRTWFKRRSSGQQPRQTGSCGLTTTRHGLRTTAINLHRNRWRKLRNFAKIRHRPAQPTDLEGLEEHLAVVSALRTLPKAHRQVVALYYLADLPVAEVGGDVGLVRLEP